jgi:hypothetical protein
MSEIIPTNRFFLPRNFVAPINHQKTKTMEVKKDKIDEMLYHAYRCLYFNEMLIKQSDSWHSAEEGNKNMEKRIMERKKKERELNQRIENRK